MGFFCDEVKHRLLMLTNLIIAHNNAEDGGGIYSTNSQHQLTNILFLNNSASGDGGGLYNNSSNLILDDITFSSNYTSDRGGAIYNYDSSPRITDSNFLHNGGDEGGAIYNSYASNPIIDRTIFKDNVAETAGGGIYNKEYNYYLNKNPLIVNSIFEGNISLDGGGIYNDRSNSKVINSTFVNNKSRFGAAIESDVADGDYIPTVINSIIWNNDSFADNKLVGNSDEADAIINNSIVEGGYNGDSIITDDPLFVDPNNFDFRLANNSAAIDAGNNDAIANFSQDLAGNARGVQALPFEGRVSPSRIAANTVDLGAYEGSGGTAPVTPSLTDESTIIYVDKDAKGKGNGASWANAYTDLQKAIAAAPFGSQIWVAEGTYKPTSKTGDDARGISFKLRNGVAIYGGFAGNETDLDRRDIGKNRTILSGDINTTGNNSDNSYHVVVADYTTSSTILDGFTISDGKANSYYYNRDNGGGIYAVQSQAVFANLTIQNNNAIDNGGGVYTSAGLNQFTNVSFFGNTAGDYGGGFYNDSASFLTNTTFNNNTAKYYGGAVYNAETLIVEGGAFVNNIAETSGGAVYSSYDSSFNLIDTVFRSNSATSSGGAIYSYDTNNDSTIVNSVFDANTSKLGGAIYNNQASAVGTNLTFANNQAESGAAIYSTGNSNDKPTYYNSIFWDNKGTSNTSPIINSGANTVVRNSIVQGGYEGLDVIDLNPKFANSDLGDFRLKSDSPAINAGLNDFVVEETDLIGNNRLVDRVDLGAYEYFAKQDLSTNPGTIGDSNIPVIEYSLEDRFNLTNIHRFYENKKGFHLYTSDSNEVKVVKEKSAAAELNYDYEAEKYKVLASNKDSLTGQEIEGVKSVYRFFNTDTGAHLYTMNESGKECHSR